MLLQKGEKSHLEQNELAKMVYMCSSLLQLAPGSRDLSQGEKRITVMQIHKMSTIFTQNDNFVHSSSRTILSFIL